jgi:hypothetical protein
MIVLNIDVKKSESSIILGKRRLVKKDDSSQFCFIVVSTVPVDSIKNWVRIHSPRADREPEFAN